MTTTITGATGVNQIQDGTIVDSDFNSSVNLGKVLQVVSALGRNADFNTSSSSLVQVTDSSISITPTSASSRIYVTWQLAPHMSAGTGRNAQLVGYRDSTAIGVVHGKRDYEDVSGTVYVDKTVHGSVFDHPNTTSSVTYSLYASTAGGGNFYAHRTWLGSGEPRMKMIAMEIEANTQWS